MLEAPIPGNENERIAALKALRILDTPTEERFERITRMAQRIFNVPITTLSLVDGHREWFKSCVGVDKRESPRTISFCGHAMMEDSLFIIPDTKKDPRFADNPMVTSKPFIRFYAGQSLSNAAGIKIGTLCIKDTKPRELTEDEKEILRSLAAWAELELNAHDLTLAVTERQKREQDLRETYEQLQKTHTQLKQTQNLLMQSEKMASIGQLAAGVAHEINNPVGFISNNMEILQEYIENYHRVFETVEKLKKHAQDGDMLRAKEAAMQLKALEDQVDLEFIKNDVNKLLEHSGRGLQRIQKIIADLRVFSHENSVDAMEPVKIEGVIDGILNIVQNELKYKAALVKEYGDTVFVRGNAQRLGQVFINLLMNAAQAIKDKGTITIRTYQEDGWVCVDIADSGMGISEENIKKIFDPFFTTKPVGQGTGLGLSVSYEIIKKHDGEIRVRSQQGQGAIFTVLLPARP